MDFSILEVLVGLFAISSIIAGASTYFFKQSMVSLKEHNVETSSRLINDVSGFTKEIKVDFRALSTDVNNRFENIYEHLDDHKKEMSARMERQQDMLSVTLRDVSRNMEKIKDEVHSQEKSFLSLRIDISDKFATKEELKKVERQLDVVSK